MSILHLAKKILIIDDEQDLTNLTKIQLELSGFCVDVAFSGMDGIKKVSEVFPDLILLDIRMPDLDGWEVLESIRSVSAGKLKDIPIIMLTVMGDDTDQIKGLNGGADDYITKPFTPDELLSRINAVLKRSGGAL